MDTIKKCFNAILHGDKKDSRFAARRVKKLLCGDVYEFRYVVNIIGNAPYKYSKISEEWRKENFILAISGIYYLHDKKEDPDVLLPWFLELLQHPNGIIRYAAVRMLFYELRELTVHIHTPGGKTKKLRPDQADNFLYLLFVRLNELLMLLWDPKYEKYEYVDSLPPSPYKSAQMALVEMEYACGKEYMDNIFEIQQKWEREIGVLLETKGQ